MSYFIPCILASIIRIEINVELDDGNIVSLFFPDLTKIHYNFKKKKKIEISYNHYYNYSYRNNILRDESTHFVIKHILFNNYMNTPVYMY